MPIAETQSDPAAWYGPEIGTSEKWIHHLDAAHVSELRSKVAEHMTTGRSLMDLDVSECRMDTFTPELARIGEEVVNGRGFALIRGVPVDDFTIEESATAFWIIGLHIGWPISQNGKGHLLGHVCDIKADLSDPNVRRYATNSAQPYHTDSCDVVSLLCLQTAKHGGLSSMSSSLTVYLEMRKTRPDLAQALSEPIAVDRKGEIPEGKGPFYMLPIFNEFDGQLSTIYNRDFINSSQRHPDAPRFTAAQIEGMDLFDTLAASPELRLDMELQRGDVQFVHNHQIVHSRTAFDDHPAVEKRRHLLRLWLAPANGRPLAPAFVERYGSITQGTRRGGIQVPGVPDQVVLTPE